MGASTSTIALEDKMANFENLSMQVGKISLSVENMLMCNISPAFEGIGVLRKHYYGFVFDVTMNRAHSEGILNRHYDF